eukprot:5204159-Amphidinium_carterae.2
MLCTAHGHCSVVVVVVVVVVVFVLFVCAFVVWAKPVTYVRACNESHAEVVSKARCAYLSNYVRPLVPLMYYLVSWVDTHKFSDSERQQCGCCLQQHNDIGSDHLHHAFKTMSLPKWQNVLQRSNR